VQVDTTTNILAEILLVSELKGTVNNPAVYLSDTACEYADLLMMTHGWTRYNIPEIMKGHFQIPKTSYERSQSYSGKVVRGLLGVPANFINISLLCYDHDYRIFDEIKTDAMGRFTFNNLEVLDSTMLLLQAKKVNGGKFALELQPEKFVYPKISLPYAQKVLWVDNSLTNYINYAELKYTYENGIRNIKLPEITIYAKNPKGKFRNYKGSPPDYFITDDDIAEKKITTIKKLILSFPNTRIRFGGSYIEAFCKGNSADAPSGYRRLSIIINGFRYDMSRRDIYEVLLETNIMIKDIAEVDLITDLITLGTYYEESCPVLEIMTYNAIQPDLYPRYFNIQTVMAEGYKRPAEFYSPRYDTQEKRSGGDPDLRSTIYWKPDALTDENGNASVEFYTADTPTSYSVVIEGVCPDGTLIYKRENKFITVN
jgi:hypothetical protein